MPRSTAAELATVAQEVERVIANAEPQQAKALLRILIAELRVNGRHDIQPTYRVITPDHATTAGVYATSGKVGAKCALFRPWGISGEPYVAQTPRCSVRPGSTSRSGPPTGAANPHQWSRTSSRQAILSGCGSVSQRESTGSPTRTYGTPFATP